ncbi:type II toxin-antitoxin system PemK/MazF family toxin [Deinococcus sp. MIMF12]|uniref:mRNA interferase n=1 Tax=Deinococcus rhizophilus TaxID=3049544 RepID=A0ABT7JD34_9DEIO|nr:type II toxin-antitoxin system PemK/MazF family toxin [Deinococcus rhizophilus]MDL2342942.1 type II toxin-antitoxin system PemK/MazF family toxin [Deinococcus rhizophilus]
MVISRGELWWADLGEPVGSRPALIRPVLVIQADSFNRSRIATVIAAVLTSNLALADAPGNVLLEAHRTRLQKDSVVNVSALVTLNKAELTERVSELSVTAMQEIDAGLRLVLGL